MQTAAGVSLTAGFMKASSYAQIAGSNSTIRAAVVGFNGKGAGHINSLKKLNGVTIAALCDADRNVINREVQNLDKENIKVKTYQDVRELLDNKDIDVVVTATPNHWHALITVWACQAGKDIYVEKPVSHNLWEGYKMVEAANKYNRIVQAGTQNRSDIGFRAALEYIKQGNIGDIQWIHGLWYRYRPSIGNVKGPQNIPEGVDYDLWTGPASIGPLMRQQFHYDWHWFWDTGSGDMGNLGVHQIDDCIFAMGYNDYPENVTFVGERFAVDDNAQTPNTNFAIFDYKPVPIIIEIRNLPRKKGMRAVDHYRRTRMGNIIQCRDGYFAGGRGGGWVYDNDDNKVKQFPGDGGERHMKNFIDAVRSRKQSDLQAPIFGGTLSASLCHIANISYRMGQKASPDKIRAQIGSHPEVQKTFDNIVEHLKANEIDLEQTPLTLGAGLKFDLKQGRFVGTDKADIANHFIRRRYREPYVIPNIV